MYLFNEYQARPGNGSLGAAAKEVVQTVNGVQLATQAAEAQVLTALSALFPVVGGLPPAAEGELPAPSGVMYSEAQTYAGVQAVAVTEDRAKSWNIKTNMNAADWLKTQVAQPGLTALVNLTTIVYPGTEGGGQEPYVYIFLVIDPKQLPALAGPGSDWAVVLAAAKVSEKKVEKKTSVTTLLLGAAAGGAVCFMAGGPIGAGVGAAGGAVLAAVVA